MAQRLQETTDLFQESVDSLAGFPVIKILKAIADRIAHIKDVQEAFEVAIAEVTALTFKQAFLKLNLDLKTINNVIDTHYLKLYKEGVVKDLKQRNFRIEEFNISAFYSNKIIEFIIDVYINDLLRNKAAVTNESIIKFIKGYFNDFLEINFHKLLSEQERVFSTFSSFLSSKEYELTLQLVYKKQYKMELKKMYEEDQVLDEEGIKLKDIYVEPNYQLNSNSLVSKDNDNHNKDNSLLSFNNSLHDFIFNILTNNEPLEFKVPNPQLILLLGYPGQGKSSFCKKFLNDILSDGPRAIDKPVYFLRLRHINKIKSLFDSPLETLKEEIELQAKGFFDAPIRINSADFESSILLLDGLDELYMSEDFNVEKVHSFVKDLVRRYLISHKNIRIIITSRYGRITPEDLTEGNALNVQLKEFSIEQQLQWLKQYKTHLSVPITLTEELITKINEDEKLQHIKELISQPILLHMVAKLPNPIDENINRAEIYKRLFTMLISRSYDKTKTLDIHKELNVDEEDLPEYLRDIIRSLAFEIFQNDKEYIHKDQLVSSSSPILNEFFNKTKNSDPQNVLRMLMMSFYLKETPTTEIDAHKDKIFHSDYAIEFLHKSLQEYMTAEKIWTEIQNLTRGEERGAGKKKKYFIEDHNWQAALKVANSLFGKRSLSNEIIDYIKEIISNEKQELRNELADRMALFLPILLEKDFLLNYNSENQSFPINIAQNSFLGFWSILSNLGTGRNYLNLPENVLYRLISFIQNQANYSYGINLSNQKFEEVDFGHIECMFFDFEKATFLNCQLQFIEFYKSNLNSIKIVDSHSYHLQIVQCTCLSSVFDYSRFYSAYFTNCQFNKASFINVLLEDAIFKNCDFIDANFTNASLIGSDLSLSNFTNVNFTDADLRGANLKYANLNGATFTNTKLTDAILTEEQLDYVKRSGAVFPEKDPNNNDVPEIQEDLPF